MNKKVVLRIFGKVQGVFFRLSAKDLADKLALTGWVRNEEDGTVKIVAEGEKEKLQKLLNWCRQGSRYAKVEDIKVAWEKYQGEYENFQIKYIK